MCFLEQDLFFDEIENDEISDDGFVFKKSTGHYWVQVNEENIVCTLSSLLRKQLIYSSDQHTTHRRVQAVKELDHTDPVAVGDRVRFTRADDSRGVIFEVLPRRSRLSRRAATTGTHAFEQVIVSNVDLVIPVFAAAHPQPSWNLLDRYLASAESLELPVLICITKIDLALETDGAPSAELMEAMQVYQQIGYEVLLTSSVTGEGINTLRETLHERHSVFIGKSGVGKTSLLNALQPGLGLRVAEIGRTTGKGRHTTSYVEMFPLDGGGAVVDTPGVREFGLWDVDGDDLAFFFREMRPYVGRCKFGLNCQHAEEPGCAIRQAVSDGQITPRRYQSYLRLKQDGYNL